ncbi:hypothetical protein F5883DRAFT_665491, partial [Diaporthe sp. PMI_573]
RGQCFACGRRGHRAEQCRDRGGGGFNDSRPGSVSGSVYGGQGGAALMNEQFGQPGGGFGGGFGGGVGRGFGGGMNPPPFHGQQQQQQQPYGLQQYQPQQYQSVWKGSPLPCCLSGVGRCRVGRRPVMGIRSGPGFTTTWTAWSSPATTSVIGTGCGRTRASLSTSSRTTPRLRRTRRGPSLRRSAMRGGTRLQRSRTMMLAPGVAAPWILLEDRTSPSTSKARIPRRTTRTFSREGTTGSSRRAWTTTTTTWTTNHPGPRGPTGALTI